MFPEGFDDWCVDALPTRDNESLNFRDFQGANLQEREVVANFLERYNSRTGFWPSISINAKPYLDSFPWILREDRPGVPLTDR